MQVVYPDAPSDFDPTECVERLAAAGLEFSYFEGPPASADEFLRRIRYAGCVVLGWDMSDAVLAAAADLRMISFTGIGVGNFVNLRLAGERQITVCNTPGYADSTVAEHTFALLLAIAKRITELDRDVRAGGWTKELDAFDLHGRTMGLVGFGGIAQRVAELAQAFGMRVLVWTRTPARYAEHHNTVEFVPLEALMASVDIVSVHCAHTPETDGLLDAGMLQRLRHDAVLINTARGAIVAEDVLLEMLRDRRILAAGLDVFATEPLPADHELRTLKNVILSPHTAYNTPSATAKIMQIALDNVLAYVRGSPINVV